MMKVGRGVPVVVSAPSGAGKTTLCRKVMSELGKFNFQFHTQHVLRVVMRWMAKTITLSHVNRLMRKSKRAIF